MPKCEFVDPKWFGRSTTSCSPTMAGSSLFKNNAKFSNISLSGIGHSLNKRKKSFLKSCSVSDELVFIFISFIGDVSFVSYVEKYHRFGSSTSDALVFTVNVLCLLYTSDLTMETRLFV